MTTKKRPERKRDYRRGGDDSSQRLALTKGQSTPLTLRVYRCELVEERLQVLPPPTSKKHGMTTAWAVSILRFLLSKADREQLVVVPCDEYGNALCASIVSIGTQKEVFCDAREILKPVILRNAPGFWIGHNHLRCGPEPSPEDISATKTVKRVASLLGIAFFDHIIISTAMPEDDEGVFSFFHSGKLEKL